MHLHFHIFAFRELALCSNATAVLLDHAGSTLKSSPPRRCVWQAAPTSRDVRAISQAPAGSAAASRACQWLRLYTFAGTCAQLPSQFQVFHSQGCDSAKEQHIRPARPEDRCCGLCRGNGTSSTGTMSPKLWGGRPTCMRASSSWCAPACNLPAATKAPTEGGLLCLHGPAVLACTSDEDVGALSCIMPVGPAALRGLLSAAHLPDRSSAHVPFSEPSVGMQGLPPSTDIRNVVAEPDLVHRGDPFAVLLMNVSAAEYT